MDVPYMWKGWQNCFHCSQRVFLRNDSKQTLHLKKLIVKHRICFFQDHITIYYDPEFFSMFSTWCRPKAQRKEWESSTERAFSHHWKFLRTWTVPTFGSWGPEAQKFFRKLPANKFMLLEKGVQWNFRHSDLLSNSERKRDVCFWVRFLLESLSADFCFSFGTCKTSPHFDIK